ncbi:MAG: hypothetical protein WCH34_00910 [Bacteroidota bacterium]
MKKSLIFLSLISISFLLGCSNSTKDSISFLKSDYGLKSIMQLILSDSTNLDKYINNLNGSYKTKKLDLIGGDLLIEVSPRLNIKIGNNFTGKKITQISVQFLFKNEKDKSSDNKKKLGEEIKKILEEEFNSDGYNKSDKYLKYEYIDAASSIISFPSLVFDYIVALKGEEYKPTIKKYLENKNNKGRLFELTHLKGNQTVPADKIWVLRSLSRCISVDKDTSDLIPGKQMSCNYVTRNNRYMYFDLVINGKCIAIEGNTLTDDGWKKYPGDNNRSPVYNDPKTMIKIAFPGLAVLFPGTDICVDNPSISAKKVLIEEYNINCIKSLNDYYEYMKTFNFNPKSFGYVDFMNLEFWKYTE